MANYYLDSNKLKSNIIYLNRKTTKEELLGEGIIMTKNFNKNLLCDIFHKNSFEGIEYDINKDHKKIIEKTKIPLNILKNLKENQKKAEKNNNPQIVFNPGALLYSILKEESLILKDIHMVSTEVFERFNELFDTKRILSLEEDIFGTFFSKNEKKKKRN